MEALVLDTGFKAIGIMDSFESFIWTDRYFRCGDFEIYGLVSTEVLSLLKADYYLWNKDSEHVMIVEDIDVNTDVDDGNHITIKGRSLESIIDRRIVWTQTTINENLQNGVKKLLDENVISPTNSDRKISNFIFEESDDEYITSLTLTAQYSGDNLYEIICSICESNHLGFKITLSDTNQFIFKLYYGVDRSYKQIENPYVVFSPNFSNIINSNYIEIKSSYKNVGLVAGEGEGASRKTVTVGNAVGLERREMFIDAGNISTNTGDETLTDSEYAAQLEERGIEELIDYQLVQSFNGEMETSQTFKLGVDYFMGDIVQTENEYGLEARSRVIEVIKSQSISGYSVYPTFENVDLDDKPTGGAGGTTGGGSGCSSSGGTAAGGLTLGTTSSTAFRGDLGQIAYEHSQKTGNPHGVTYSDVGADASGSASTALTNAKSYTDSKIADLINGAPTTLDTLKEIADAMVKNEDVVTALKESIGNKASSTDFNNHKSNTTVHVTATERETWNSKAEAEHAHTVDDISDTLPVSKGGTGQTTAKDAANAFMNALDTASVTPSDADYYISQYARGGTTNTTYYRRPLSALWSWIKGKADKVYATISHTHDYVPLEGGTMTGPLVIKGSVASKPLTTRGIVGSDGNNNTGELYLQYGAKKPIHLGTTGAYTISADGGTYSGQAASAAKIPQNNTSTSSDYRLILSANANDTTETNVLQKSANFTANPSTGAFYAKGYKRINITGQTLDVDTLTLAAGSPEIMLYIEKHSAGSANIANIPVAGSPFILDVELIRWISATDYITRQTFISVGALNYRYVRYCFSGTWHVWKRESYYAEVSGTLPKGSTFITLSHSAITTNSELDFYTSIYGVSPTAVTVSTGSVKLTFKAQSADMTVKVKIT